MPPKILLLAHDNKIGDSIIHTGILNPIVKIWPNAEIGVLCGDINIALYKNHPNVKWLHVSPSRSILIRAFASLKARFKNYDYLVYFGLDVNKSSFKKICSVVNPRQRILFANPTKRNASDIVLDGDWSNCHISNRHLTFLHWIGSKLKHYHYDIKLNVNAERTAKNQLSKSSSTKYIIINSRGSSKDKCLPNDWVEKLIIRLRKFYPKHQFLILSTSKKDELNLSDKFSRIDKNLKIIPYKSSVDSNLAVIKNIDAIITSDTYVVHAACAWNIPVLALYSMHAIRDNHHVIFGPKSERYTQLIPPKKGIEAITIKETVDAFNRLMKHKKIQDCNYL
jgi:ADP-heptose:LPS heptosyltransferase